MKIEFKINKKARYKYFYGILLEISFWYALTILLIVFFKSPNSLGTLLMFSLIFAWMWIILSVIPLILLYYNHTKFSESAIFKFDSSKSDFTFIEGRKTREFNDKDIQEIIIHLSPSLYEKWVDWLFFGKYHYAYFILKNGESFSISCLVCDQIDSIFPNNIISRKKKVLPFMRNSVE